MVPQFKSLLEYGKNMETIQLFSGGSSLGPRMKDAILGAIGDGRIKSGGTSVVSDMNPFGGCVRWHQRRFR